MPSNNKDHLHEFLNNTDFDLLYKQKLALLQANETNQPLSEEDLEGLLNFLDFIGDWAESDGGHKRRNVLPPHQRRTQ